LGAARQAGSLATISQPEAAMLLGTRVLHVKRRTGTVEVPVRLSVPVEDELGWKCRYDIGWPGKVRSSAAWGIDALQAVHLTMQKIASELYASRYHKEGRLSWGEGGGYGFPMPKNGRDLLVGYDKEFNG
jgi:hypothetical protein